MQTVLAFHVKSIYSDHVSDITKNFVCHTCHILAEEISRATSCPPLPQPHPLWHLKLHVRSRLCHPTLWPPWHRHKHHRGTPQLLPLFQLKLLPLSSRHKWITTMASSLACRQPSRSSSMNTVPLAPVVRYALNTVNGTPGMATAADPMRPQIAEYCLLHSLTSFLDWTLPPAIIIFAMWIMNVSLVRVLLVPRIVAGVAPDSYPRQICP